jgi:hypothetical protein
MSALGKRRTAVLAVLADRRRATGADIAHLVREGHGIGMTIDGALDTVIGLENRGLAEKDEPHMDRGGKLRGTWRPTAEGDQVATEAGQEKEGR